MTRAVLFDLFGTLVAAARTARRETSVAMAVRLGVEPDAFDRAYEGMATDRFTGAYTLPGLVRELAVRAGGDPDDEAVAHACGLRRDLNRRMLVTVPGRTLDALGALRAAGWGLGLVSNCTAETPDPWRESPLRPLFDVTVFSCDVGLVKPDAAIYRLACSRLGVEPAACVYVGDGADHELAGARAVGMRAVRITEYADSDPGWDGEQVASVGELVGLLGSGRAGAAS